MDRLLAGDVAVITGPAVEPVTLTEAKLHLRVDHSTDDTLITSLIVAARQYVEDVTWRALVTQTLEVTLDDWPDGEMLVLPRPPLASVTSVKYVDSDGTETTWAAGNYQVVTQGTPGRLVLAYGVSWPSVTLRAANGITVRYVAGYGLAAAVPDLLKTAIKLMVGHWYENREATVVAAGTVATELPLAVQSILNLYKVR